MGCQLLLHLHSLREGRTSEKGSKQTFVKSMNSRSQML